MLIARAFCHKATTHTTHRLAFRNHPTGSISALRSPIRRSGSSSCTSFLKSHVSKSDNDNVVVTYLTDVEGDKAYLDRYVNLSKILTFQQVTPRLTNNDESKSASSFFPYDHCMEFSNPNGMLVYGGDVWDKGGSDLYVIRQLNDLKRRYPDRVHILLGNRDINKLRMLQELGLKSQQEQSLPHHPGLNFLRGTGRIGDPEFQAPPDTAVERLKWILSQSMGSPNAFDLRKSELEWEQTELLGSSSKQVTDEDVVVSYQTSCHPNGELGQYLSGANLAVRLGQVLFVHGSLPLTKDILHERDSHFWDDLTCYMPWLRDDDAKTNHGVKTIDDWLDALNGFCHTQVQQWKEGIAQIEDGAQTTTQKENAIWSVQGGYHYGPSGSGLIQYGMGMTPDFKSNPTVVYSSWTTNGMPRRFFPNADEQRFAQATKEFFEKAQLRLIVAGHQPQGDMPSPIRINTTSVEPSWVLCCDTSYSGDTLWYHLPENATTTTSSGQQQTTPQTPPRTNLGRGTVKSFRGEVAVSEVLMELDAQQTIQSVKYHGVLSDGSEYETINLIDDADATAVGQIAPDSLVPSETDSPHQGPWWTKMVFSDGSHLFHAAEGYSAWNLFHPKQ